MSNAERKLTANAAAERSSLTVEAAIRGRQSIRAYLDTPVPREIITRIQIGRAHV